MSAEATVVESDWMTELPWSNKSKINTDLKNAQNTRRRSLWCEKVKERIIEFLAVEKNAKMKGPILCLVGPQE